MGDGGEEPLAHAGACGGAPHEGQKTIRLILTYSILTTRPVSPASAVVM